MGFFPRVRIPGTAIHVYPGSNPKRIAKRVVKYNLAKRGLSASPWRLVPRPARKAYFTGRFLRALFRRRYLRMCAILLSDRSGPHMERGDQTTRRRCSRKDDAWRMNRMMYKEAVDASPLDAAINITGNQGVIIRRWNGGYETLAQRPDTSEWEHVGINYGATVGLDRHAWEPLAERLDGIAR